MNRDRDGDRDGDRDRGGDRDGDRDGDCDWGGDRDGDRDRGGDDNQRAENLGETFSQRGSETMRPLAGTLLPCLPLHFVRPASKSSLKRSSPSATLAYRSPT